MMKPKVKICGITNIGDAALALQSGADALGFVFFKNSPRYITPARAKEIIELLPPWVFKVGVFVDEKTDTVKKISNLCGLDFLQLHGDEDLKYLKKLRGFRLIKAIRIKDDLPELDFNHLPCDLILFDCYSKNEFGGTGNKFNWKLAKEIRQIKLPYIISGGLNTGNVKEAVKKFMPYAVDISSGVEKSAGKKDKKLVEQFIENAKG